MVKEKNQHTQATETTNHIRFQQRKPYVKAVQTDGAGLVSQEKDVNNVVTITSYNDQTKEQKIKGDGDLIEIKHGKNGTNEETIITVKHDDSKLDKNLNSLKVKMPITKNTENGAIGFDLRHDVHEDIVKDKIVEGAYLSTGIFVLTSFAGSISEIQGKKGLYVIDARIDHRGE